MFEVTQPHDHLPNSNIKPPVYLLIADGDAVLVVFLGVAEGEADSLAVGLGVSVGLAEASTVGTDVAIGAGATYLPLNQTK